MNKKEWLEKLKRPTGWLLVLIYALSLVFIAGALVILFVDYAGTALEIVAYALFALAACFLAYSVYTFVLYFPGWKHKIAEKIRTFPFMRKMMDNFGFRTVMTSVLSLALSVLYSVYNGVIAVVFLSIWYGALAAYYVILASIRGGIVFYHGKNRGKRRDEETDVLKYRNCGILLIITILALSVAILQMVAADAFFERAGLLIYAAAAYTFYKITMSIVNFVRAKKETDFTVQAVRNVNFADALVSVLALQTSMFHAFAEPSATTSLANALTGAGVCLLVLLLGVYMIITANKELKRIRSVHGENESI